MDFSDIEPPEITFKESLFSSEFSVIFLVGVRGKICLMKVVSNYLSEFDTYLTS